MDESIFHGRQFATSTPNSMFRTSAGGGGEMMENLMNYRDFSDQQPSTNLFAAYRQVIIGQKIFKFIF